ncbi:MAG: peptidase M16, partial [Deltaproteobacteria bacterium]|nr:peptidase M16 [Deltaproteobacteria bacterium]
LIGMPGSPLRKALIGSGLGEDITGVGLEDELRQMFFSVGLKGVDVADAGAVEAVVLDTLSRLAQEGIDPRTIEASLNTIEFRLRENNTGSYPRGLIVMLRSLTTWLYDHDPLTLLKFELLLSWVTSSFKTGPRYFENLIDTWFLENQHRTTVMLKPDRRFREQLEENERAALARARESMDERQLQAIIDNTKLLKELQETPDAPEVLATIPVLKLSDLDTKNKSISCELLDYRGVNLLYHDLDTSGIFYLDVGFDLRVLPERYLPYVPLFGRALLQMGTEKEDYVDLSKRISRETGGIRSASFTSVVKESGGTAARLFLRCKTMTDRADNLLAILRDILSCPALDNRERFRQMVLEEKARQEQALIPGGHQIVNIRLRSHFTESGWLSEKMNGISYLFFIRKLADRVDSDWEEVRADCEDMLRLLVNRNAMIVNGTVDGAARSALEPRLYRFLDELPAAEPEIVQWTCDECEQYEGLVIPAQVNYVGKGANVYAGGYELHGSSKVITRYLRNSWLWDRVRVQGGAYGAFCIFNSLSGVLTMISYRDPNLVTTIAAFDGAAQFLRKLDLNRSELAKGIIGAIGDMDSYMLPDEKGYTSMLWHLSGNDAESRQRIRDEILSTTPDNFADFADVLDLVRQKGIIKALGSERAIEVAVTEHRLPLNIIHVL